MSEILSKLKAYKKAIEEADERGDDTPSDGDPEWQRLFDLRLEEQTASKPWPRCCSEMVQHRGLIYARLPEVFYDLPEGLEKRILVPQWRMSYRPLGKLGGIARPQCCPFCGTPLPKLRLKDEPPKPLCRVEDGGYYCMECGDRLGDCLCYPSEAAFEIEDPASTEDDEPAEIIVKQGDAFWDDGPGW